ncbi:MAG: hypothetical protein KatS3mg105_1979 [Gemmatales bacterium]|nr:MAG: hypothetical protein KatS3mg105_1979 [Gemmatales bacterium]
MTAMRRRLLNNLAVGGLVVLAHWFGCFSSPAEESQHAKEIFFEKHVRPLLAQKCYRCHGPKKQMSGLRLDSREAILKGGDQGPSARPGDPAKSLLIHAVRREGDLKMPPRTPLSPSEIKTLVHWIQLGMPWPAAAVTKQDDSNAWKTHWAFQPIRLPPIPATKDRTWAKTPIDAFILARLEANNLKPGGIADRRTLIRRATFDLIGLPPTPQEVREFVNDPSPDAYAKVIDRLLASPHYGEHWGRHWLDVARYADNKGYVFLQDSTFPWAWTYRDYVIRAFNEDLPYDRFLLEQLAADQLPFGKDRRPLTAMGFLTVGSRFMNNIHDIIDDRIDVVMRGLMGLTVSCARCHDHKFDPIPTADYYSLYGIFASSVEPPVPPLFEDPPNTEAYRKFDEELQARIKRLTDFVRAKQSEVTTSAKTRMAEYLLRVHATRNQPRTDNFMLLADGRDLNPKMVERWRVFLERRRRKHDPVFGLWFAYCELPPDRFADEAAKLTKKWISQGDPQKPINRLVAVMFSEPPRTLEEAARRYQDLLTSVDRRWQECQKRPQPPKAFADPAEEELRQVFYGPQAPPQVPVSAFGDLALLPDRPSQNKLKELRKAVEDWRVQGKGAPPRAMVLVDAAKPFEPYVFKRGNPNNVGPRVHRQPPLLLGGAKRQPFRQGSGRLELARLIADEKNPLTARVLVNRVWLHHFGEGLVSTPSDFGLRSDPPSHPELLDYLAATFMADGWSLKKLHRRIMLSAVYQQKSDLRKDCLAVDPDNRLLWRMNRRRLEFEVLRDSLLAVSGRLDRTMGGKPVKDLTSRGTCRRTVYNFVDRLNLPELWRSFDFPSPAASNPKRNVTTVPQQALFLMNNPFLLECAERLLARDEISRQVSLPDRITALYQQVFCRPPTDEERRLVIEFVREAGNERTGWLRLCQALLLTNEFAFID